jgi:hypothetical protein
MKTTDPQAAPPETDLRAQYIEIMAVELNMGLPLDGGDPDDPEDEPDDGMIRAWHIDEAQRVVKALNDAGFEIERRLARPDALRERVMAAIDEWWESDTRFTRIELKAAVAAVLEDA